MSIGKIKVKAIITTNPEKDRGSPRKGPGQVTQRNTKKR